MHGVVWRCTLRQRTSTRLPRCVCVSCPGAWGCAARPTYRPSRTPATHATPCNTHAKHHATRMQHACNTVQPQASQNSSPFAPGLRVAGNRLVLLLLKFWACRLSGSSSGTTKVVFSGKPMLLLLLLQPQGARMASRSTSRRSFSTKSTMSMRRCGGGGVFVRGRVGRHLSCMHHRPPCTPTSRRMPTRHRATPRNTTQHHAGPA
jgi:hypothetical protein